MVRVRAPAKLNLGLSIRDRRSDGYHEIETVFVPIRLFDEIELRRISGPSVRLAAAHPGLPADSRNLAVRGAEATLEALGELAGIELRLEKRIPLAAGLGGGSSDAAAAIRGVEALLGRDLGDRRRSQLALELGADVPFFLDPCPALGTGIGACLSPLAEVPEMWWLLVVFPFGVSTPTAYREAARELTLPREGSSIAALLGPGGLCVSPGNDLETVATRRHPEIRQARKALERVGAQVSGMSGSGPTVYGRFRNREDAESGRERIDLPAGARAVVVSSPGSEAGNWGWGVAKW